MDDMNADEELSEEQILMCNVVKAWTNIGNGEFTPEAIQNWLINTMKPAINDIRQYLRDHP